MRRAEFIKLSDNYIVQPGEFCDDGKVHLGRYREAHLLFNGLTRYRRDPRMQRQISVFGVVGMRGEQSYYVFHSDCSERGGVVSSYYPMDQVDNSAKGVLLRGGVPDENIFLPASDSAEPARFGTHKLQLETIHDSLRGNNNLPLPSAAMPVSYLRDLVALERV